MTSIPLQPVVAALPRTAPFIGPETLERESGLHFRARMGANESPFGPAPAVIEAVGQATLDMGRYGDAEAYALRTSLGMALGVAPPAITIGEGIDGVFASLCRIYLAPGDPVVTSLGAYPTFLYHARAAGAEIVTVPYRDQHNDLDALADAARTKSARIVFLANPDNPTGSHQSAPAIEAFLDAVPATSLVVLDEAYAEFAPEGTLPPVTLERENIIRTRTFSKAHGLAGMRIGYGFANPGVIDAFDRVRNHFGVTRLSQIAALEALRASDWTADVVERTRAGLAEISRQARDCGLNPLPTATNFVAIDCGRDGRYADAVLDGLATRGVFIRKPRVAGLDHLIRVSIGAPEEVAIFGQELPRVLSRLG